MAVLPHITETSWKCSAPTKVTKVTGRAERRLSADSMCSRVKADTSLTASIQFKIRENLQSRAHGVKSSYSTSGLLLWLLETGALAPTAAK